MINITRIYQDIYNLIKSNKFVFKNEIPSINVPKPIFANGDISIVYKIDPGADENYRKDLELEILLTSNKEYKLEVQQKAFEVHKQLNNELITNGRIKGANAPMRTVEENEKTNVIMQYYILVY